jgi:fatty acid desaturase
MGYYADATQQFRNELARAIPRDEIKRLHQKRPWLHFAVTAGLVAVLAGSTFAIVSLDAWYFWLPLAAVSGLAIFNFTVLLHEVVHRAVVRETSPGIYRFLGLLYAVPSGISASQFTRCRQKSTRAGSSCSTSRPRSLPSTFARRAGNRRATRQSYVRKSRSSEI